MSDENTMDVGEESSTQEDVQEDSSTSEENEQKDKSVPYNRFQEVVAERNELRKRAGLDDNGNPLKGPQADDEDVSKDVAALKERQAKADFRDEHKLSREQMDWLWKSTNGNPTEDDLNDAGIKAALKEIGRQATVEDNTPSGRRGAPTYNGKTWNEIATDSSLSDKDKQKAFDNLTNSKAGKR